MRLADGWRRLIALVLVGVPLGQAAAQSPTPMADWQLSAGVALVSYFAADDDPAKVPRWQNAIAAGAVHVPAYEGGNQSRQIPIGAVEFRYRDLAYFSTSEGLGVNFLQGKRYRIGTSLGYDIGRQERRDPLLTGLGDLDAAAELKLYAERVVFPLVLRASVRHTLDGSTGWSADFGAYLPLAATKRFFLFAGPAVAVADGSANRRRFGITSAQAMRSGLPEYSASGGIRSASLGFSATYFFHDDYFVNATGSRQRLLGNAADSPIVRDKTQQALLLIVGYRW